MPSAEPGAMTTTATPTAHRADDEPYCSACGYTLTGLTESSKCPECGRPLVEVLTRPAFASRYRGKRYQSKAKIFGVPVVSVALGPYRNEKRGHAKGLIAIGDIATGGIAIGGLARGVVAVGGLSIGVCAFGGCCVGLLTAMGGLAVGTGLSVGGVAAGSVAVGGTAVGFVTQGGVALGPHARGGNGGPGPGSAAMFESLKWLLGTWPPPLSNPFSVLRAAFLPPVLAIVLGTVIAFMALTASRREATDASSSL